MPFLAPLAGAVAGAAGTAAGAVGSAASAVGGALGTAAGAIGEAVGPALTAAAETVGQAPAWLAEQAGGLGQGLMSPVAESPLSGAGDLVLGSDVIPFSEAFMSPSGMDPGIAGAMGSSASTPASMPTPSVMARPELTQVAMPTQPALPPSQFGGAPMYSSYGGLGSPYYDMMKSIGVDTVTPQTQGFGMLKPGASPGIPEAPPGTMGPFNTWQWGDFMEDFVGGEGLTTALENQGPVQEWLAQHPNWQKGLDIYQKYGPINRALSGAGYGDDTYKQQPMAPAPPPVPVPTPGGLSIPIEFYLR